MHEHMTVACLRLEIRYKLALYQISMTGSKEKIAPELCGRLHLKKNPCELKTAKSSNTHITFRMVHSIIKIVYKNNIKKMKLVLHYVFSSFFSKSLNELAFFNNSVHSVDFCIVVLDSQRNHFL